jgi:hypothetical protein
MVQVLPPVLSPLQQLMPQINQFAGALGQGLRQRDIRNQDQEAMQKYKDATTPMEKAEAFAGMSKDKAKSFAPYLKAEQDAAAAKEREASQMRLNEQKSGLRKEELAESNRFKIEENERQEAEEVFKMNNLIDGIEKRLASGGDSSWQAVLAKNIPRSKWGQERRYIKETGPVLSDAFYNYLNRGPMTDKKLNMVTKDWSIKEYDRDYVTQAKIEMMRDALKRKGFQSDEEFDKFIKPKNKELEAARKKDKAAEKKYGKQGGSEQQRPSLDEIFG